MFSLRTACSRSVNFVKSHNPVRENNSFTKRCIYYDILLHHTQYRPFTYAGSTDVTNNKTRKQVVSCQIRYNFRMSQNISKSNYSKSLNNILLSAIFFFFCNNIVLHIIICFRTYIYINSCDVLSPLFFV